MTPGPRVRLTEVSAGYRSRLRVVPVLREVSWEAHPGEVTALVGANGAGKTTTLRILLGLLAPRRGTVRVGPLPPGRHRTTHGTGFLPEDRVPLPGWTVRGLVRAGGGDGETLRRMGLQTLAERRVDSLSRGEARSALLAFVLADDPGLVLLDEPWSGLDPAARERLGEELGRLRALGRTVVVSSHEILEVVRVADRVLVMGAGTAVREVERGVRTPEELERAIRGSGP